VTNKNILSFGVRIIFSPESIYTCLGSSFSFTDTLKCALHKALNAITIVQQIHYSSVFLGKTTQQSYNSQVGATQDLDLIIIKAWGNNDFLSSFLRVIYDIISEAIIKYR